MPAQQEDELVAEVDLALAALRRVILRALDLRDRKPAPKDALLEHLVAPVADPIIAADIEIDLVTRTAKHNGACVTLVTSRQAQLAAVLAKASPYFIGRESATARAWPDLAVSSRATTVTPAIRALAETLGPIGITVEEFKGYGLRMRKGKP